MKQGLFRCLDRFRSELRRDLLTPAVLFGVLFTSLPK
mgnify:CR=1 FL=1